MNENSYALKSPDELLRLFTLLYGTDRLGAKYTCEYIKGILKNKGYNILIEGNIYSLELIMPNKETMYDMPINELMNLYHKLVNKKNIPYIPDKLRKTLMRRVNSILNNRGCTVHKDDFKPVIFEGLKDAMVYAQATGNNDWVVMSAMSAMDIGRRMHELVFGEDKENVNLTKENKMKNIVIKLENHLLANYVVNKLANDLRLKETHKITPGFEKCIMSIKIDEGTIHTACCDLKQWKDAGAKYFTITAARNTDTIIEEVIKEYNKIEVKSFTIGGAYTGHTIPVIVYPDKISFNNEYMTFDKFIALRNNLIGQIGGFQIGGVGVILFTHSRTQTKVYVQRDEFIPIIDAILARLSA